MKSVIFIAIVAASLAGCPSQVFLDPPSDSGSRVPKQTNKKAHCASSDEAQREDHPACKDEGRN